MLASQSPAVRAQFNLIPGATRGFAIARIRVVVILGSASGWRFLNAPLLVSRVEQGSFAPAFNPAATLISVLCGAGASWKAACTAPYSLPYTSLVVIAATYLMPGAVLIQAHAQSVLGAQRAACRAALSVGAGVVSGVHLCTVSGEATGGAVPNPSLQRTRFARR